MVIGRLNTTLLVAVASLMPSCSALMDWQTKHADNPVEEKVEEFIEDNTGAEIDLSPVTGPETQSQDILKKK